jgi:hypothetical protein
MEEQFMKKALKQLIDALDKPRSRHGNAAEHRLEANCTPVSWPLNEFIGGFTAFVGNDAICIPDWGAAFRHQTAREEFVKSKQPAIGQCRA